MNVMGERCETFSADLIDGYATRVEVTHWRGKPHEHAYYDPPENGIHLCAQGAFEASATAARYPMGAKRARDLFVIAKAVAECGPDEGDFVADLCVSGDIIDDFWTNRQIWPQAIAAWNLHPERPDQ
jgi:hypothetical protein